MKKIAFLLIFLLLLADANSYAQKQKGKAAKETTVSPETRAQSVLFANALKDYYAENYRGAEKQLLDVISANPKHASSFYMLGKVKKESRDFAAAEHYFLQATALDKENIWYLVALAELYDLQGNVEKSAPLWAKICKMDTHNEYYLYYYSNALFSQQRYKEVIKVYDQLENVIGTNPELTQAKVQLWLQLDDVKSAAGEYDKLIKKDPYNPEYYIQIANLYVNNNLPELAVPYFEKFGKINPDNAEIQFVMGNYYETKGDKAAAFKAWKVAFSSEEIPIERKLPILRQYLTKLGSQPATEEQYTLCKALTEAHPNALEGWAALASLYLSDRKYGEAAANFEKALQIDEAQFAIWEDYLYCLAQTESYEKIILLENDLNELFPSSSMIDFTLGSAYYNKQDYEKALSYFQHALTVTYDKKEIAHINNMIGNVYSKMGDEAKAQEYFRKSN